MEDEEEEESSEDQQSKLLSSIKDNMDALRIYSKNKGRCRGFSTKGDNKISLRKKSYH
jgi:hypothetical protein